MNVFQVDIKEKMPYIIEAYSEVYGKQYKELLENREKNICYIIYSNSEDIKRYKGFLDECKQRELAIRFLEKIGINVTNQKQKGYAVSLDEDLESIFRKLTFGYIGKNPKGIKQVHEIIDKIDFNGEVTNETVKKCYDKIVEEYEIFLKEELSKYDSYIEQGQAHEQQEPYYTCVGPEFINEPDKFKNSTSLKNAVCNIAKQQRTCVQRATLNDNITIPIIFFGLGIDSGARNMKVTSDGEIIFYRILHKGGGLNELFLHELGHAFETVKVGNEFKCGFDKVNEDERNPYNKRFRKYERLNETVKDILTSKVRKKLSEQGIDIFEPKEYTFGDDYLENINTHSIVRKMLMPFVDRYMEHISRALLLGDTNELFGIIGEENFEELNDTVNKVDSLISIPFLESYYHKQESTPSMIEYGSQLKRIGQIYANMEQNELKRASERKSAEATIDKSSEDQEFDI